MESILLDMGVSFVLSALKAAVKNPARKAELKKVMLKIYTVIGTVFADDSDFANASVKQ